MLHHIPPFPAPVDLRYNKPDGYHALVDMLTHLLALTARYIHLLKQDGLRVPLD